MNDYKFGNYLCELRLSRGLSQSELGKLLGVSDKAVSKWETGAAKPQTSKLLPLAEILGVRVEDLLSGECSSPIPEAGAPESTGAPSASRVDFSTYVGIRLQEMRSKRKKSGQFFLLSLLPLLFAILSLILCEGAGVDDTVIGPLSALFLVLLTPAFLLLGILFLASGGKIRRELFKAFPERARELELMMLGASQNLFSAEGSRNREKQETPEPADFETVFSAFCKARHSLLISYLPPVLILPLFYCGRFFVLLISNFAAPEASTLWTMLILSLLICPMLLIGALIFTMVELIRSNRCGKQIFALYPYEMAAYTAKYKAFMKVRRRKNAIRIPMILTIAAITAALILTVLIEFSAIPLLFGLWAVFMLDLAFSAGAVFLCILRSKAEHSFDLAWLAKLNP